jgi:hypothetical protein
MSIDYGYYIETTISVESTGQVLGLNIWKFTFNYLKLCCATLTDNLS